MSVYLLALDTSAKREDDGCDVPVYVVDRSLTQTSDDEVVSFITCMHGGCFRQDVKGKV